MRSHPMHFVTYFSVNIEEVLITYCVYPVLSATAYRELIPFVRAAPIDTEKPNAAGETNSKEERAAFSKATNQPKTSKQKTESRKDEEVHKLTAGVARINTGTDASINKMKEVSINESATDHKSQSKPAVEEQSTVSLSPAVLCPAPVTGEQGVMGSVEPNSAEKKKRKRNKKKKHPSDCGITSD